MSRSLSFVPDVGSAEQARHLEQIEMLLLRRGCDFLGLIHDLEPPRLRSGNSRISRPPLGVSFLSFRLPLGCLPLLVSFGFHLLCLLGRLACLLSWLCRNWFLHALCFPR